MGNRNQDRTRRETSTTRRGFSRRVIDSNMGSMASSRSFPDHERGGAPYETGEPQAQHPEDHVIPGLEGIHNKLDQRFSDLEKHVTQLKNEILRSSSATSNSNTPSRGSPFGVPSFGLQNFVWGRRIASGSLEHLEQENTALSNQINQVTSDKNRMYAKLNSLKFSYDQSQQNLAKSKQDYDNLVLRAQKFEAENNKEIESKAKEIDGLKAAVQPLESRNELLQENIKKLRGIILGKSKGKSEEIDDGTVTAAFARLRDQIQRAIHKCYSFDPLVQPPNFTGNSHPLMQKFYGYWANDLTAEQLVTRARAIVFEIINHIILHQPQFGLESKSFGDMGEQLGRFELALLQNAPNYENEIVEWRTRTLKCAALLKCDQLQASKVANNIWKLMEPFMHFTPPHTTSDDSDHLNMWREICDEATKFAILVRSSKDEYKCEAPTHGREVLEAEMSVQDKENEASGNAEDNAIVSFAIFGALVKYPEHNTNKRLILEKAYVVTCQHLMDREDEVL